MFQSNTVSTEDHPLEGKGSLPVAERHVGIQLHLKGGLIPTLEWTVYVGAAISKPPRQQKFPGLHPLQYTSEDTTLLCWCYLRAVHGNCPS